MSDDWKVDRFNRDSIELMVDGYTFIIDNVEALKLAERLEEVSSNSAEDDS